MRLKLLAALFVLASFATAQSIQQRRIVRPIDNTSTVRLPGTLVPRARAELDRGPVAAAMPMQHMSMVFARTAEQQAGLDQLLAEQQDRTSPNYHKWLTPEEFGDRFGLAQSDVDVIAAWLTSQGFTIDDIARSRTWIAFSGIAAQVEAAFHAPIDNFLVDGTLHYAPSVEPAVPGALSGVVSAITGLHDFHPHLHSRVRRVNPQLTSSISGNHFIVPGDFGTIYDLPDYASGVFQPGNDGSGQTIGIVAQTSGNTTSGVAVSTVSSDTATFRSIPGLPAGSLTLTPVGTTTAFTSSEADEANLDVQWAGSVAPNAAIILAYSTDALQISLQSLVDQNLASVISLSYGLCEAHYPNIATVEGYLAQANAQGQTVTAAAGDNGATDCDGTAQAPVTTSIQGLAVDYPASSVYITAMGGTEFTGDSEAGTGNGVAPPTQYWNGSSDPNDTSASAFSYIPEMAWNDTVLTGTNVATGGGTSGQFAKPSWQTGNGVPSDGQRDLPDLALSSSPNHDGYIICSQGNCQTGYRRNSDQTFTVIGGTSASAPSFAGIVALANQKLGARQGNLNPQIYSLAASSQWAFNDITTGDNKVVCTVGTTNCAASPIGYSAGPGYDLATGWGSIDASGFLNALAGQPAQPSFYLSPASRALTVTGNSALISTAIAVLPRQGMTGPVNLTCSLSTTLPGSTCTIDTSLNVGGSATLMIFSGTNPTTSGTQTGTATVQATSGNLNQTLPIAVTINYGTFSLGIGGVNFYVAPGGTASTMFNVAGQNGYADTVNLSCTATAGLTCSLTPVSVVLQPNVAATGVTLTVNATASASSGTVTITGQSTNVTQTLQVPVTVANPGFTLTVASPVVSIPSGVAITDNLTVAPVAGFTSDVALTCGVSSSLGTTTCSISPATVTGGSGTAVVTLTGAVLTQDRGAPLPFQHRGLGAYATFVFALGIVFTAKPKREFPTQAGCPGQASFAWVGFVRKGLFALLLLCMMFGALSCGGGGGGSSSGSGPTPLNGNVTITGVGGGITQTATINVTVQ